MALDLRALKELEDGARQWARTYVAMVEELVRCGVTDEMARYEARCAMGYAAFIHEDDEEDEVV